MSASKIVFLKLLPQSLDLAANQHKFASEFLQSSASEKTAVVLNRTKEDFFTIQGYPSVPYKEKHKSWLLFRTAVRSLLGIAEGASISIRFADSPFTTVSNVDTVLQEPSHIVNLTVSVLASPTEDTTDNEIVSKLVDEQDTCDPYCKYRRLFPARQGCSTAREGGLVRTKYNFAEMNRLLSQLTDVSLSLQRTQQQCDEIAERCRKKEEQAGASASQQKKGNSAENKKGGAVRDGMVAGPVAVGVADDSNVEKLLCLAQSLTQRLIQQQKLGANAATATSLPTMSCQSRDSPGSGVVLPDYPSDVSVRPNFSRGAYVMWNPVSLDVRDENKGHRVQGYVVYVNGQPRGKVEGALTSHAEIQGLEGEKEYKIQVGTLGELCNSPLSPPIPYRHVVTPHRTHSALSRCKSQPIASYHKAARVESWLKMNSGGTSGMHAASMSALGDSCFRSNNNMMAADNGTHLPFVEGSIHVLTQPVSATPPTTTLLGDNEDTRSTSSSHTSGIVTDMPTSPKLSPACSCKQCMPYASSTPSPQHSPSTHHHQHHPPPKNHTTIGSTSTLSVNNIDNVIDEPLVLPDHHQPSRSSHHLPTAVPDHHPPSFTPHLLHPALRVPTIHKGPLPPQNVRVKTQLTGYFTVCWTPVRRDLRGCSNGHYVLGYRVYLNGNSHMSVDGPMTYETQLQCSTEPLGTSHHRVLIHVRTRSIAGESHPSNTVVCNLLLHQFVERPRRRKVDSAISSTDSTILCQPEPLHSTQVMATASKEHPVRFSPKIETCV